MNSFKKLAGASIPLKRRQKERMQNTTKRLKIGSCLGQFFSVLSETGLAQIFPVSNENENERHTLLLPVMPNPQKTFGL